MLKNKYQHFIIPHYLHSPRRPQTHTNALVMISGELDGRQSGSLVHALFLYVSDVDY